MGFNPETGDSSVKITFLSFDKGGFGAAFYQFEQQWVFALKNLFSLYTHFEFQDLAVPAHRKMLRLDQSPEDQLMDLYKLATSQDTDYVLFGELTPTYDIHNGFESLQVRLCLYDHTTQSVRLDAIYPVEDFDSPPELDHFQVSLMCLENLSHWVVGSLFTLVSPASAGAIWEKLNTLSLCKYLPQWIKLAQAHYLPTDQPERLTLLEGLTQGDPQFGLAQLELGYHFKRQQQYQAAALALEWAYQHLPAALPKRRANIANEIGICFALHDNKALAFEWWKAATKLAPQWINPYLNLAHANEEMGNLDGAALYFRKVGEIDPEDIRAYFNLARIYSKQERWDDAIVQYELQLRIEPDNIWTVNNLANSYLQKGDIDNARRYFERTRDLDPESEAGKLADILLSRIEAVEA